MNQTLRTQFLKSHIILSRAQLHIFQLQWNKTLLIFCFLTLVTFQVPYWVWLWLNCTVFEYRWQKIVRQYLLARFIDRSLGQVVGLVFQMFYNKILIYFRLPSLWVWTRSLYNFGGILLFRIDIHVDFNVYSRVIGVEAGQEDIFEIDLWEFAMDLGFERVLGDFGLFCVEGNLTDAKSGFFSGWILGSKGKNFLVHRFKQVYSKMSNSLKLHKQINQNQNYFVLSK